MKTSKYNSFIFTCLLVYISWLTVIGCEYQPSIVDPLNIRDANIGEANFNPQPEPPPNILEFQITGDPSGDWTGHFPGFRQGRIDVETRSTMQRGKTVHVVQTWMIVPPEPIFPPEPIVPPEPVLVSLKGILNLASGKVVLNGMSEKLGVNAHVRGQVTKLSNGGFSIGGELMFNPQPEPPPSSSTFDRGDR